MSGNRGDAWDSYSGDQFDSVNREYWDEEDWEAFLTRQDVLKAKYQELYETLCKHPDRDALIAREMGQNLPEDALGLFPALPDDAYDGYADDQELLGEGEADLDDPEICDLEAIPAYRMAEEFALAVERQLTARLRDRAAVDEDASEATRAGAEISATIANGHGIGYERDSLCGNIACCKRALGGLAECLDSLLVLRRRGVLLPAEADGLLTRGRKVGEAITQRIEELRRRVWWR